MMLVRRDRAMVAVTIMLDIAFHSGRAATVSAADMADRCSGHHPVSRAGRACAAVGAGAMTRRLSLAPWTYGFIVALAMWVATTAYSGLGSAGATLSATALMVNAPDGSLALTVNA